MLEDFSTQESSFLVTTLTHKSNGEAYLALDTGPNIPACMAFQKESYLIILAETEDSTTGSVGRVALANREIVMTC